MLFRCCSMFVLGTMMSVAAAQDKSIPRVVLIGDSIRLGYAPLVAKKLEGKAIVISAKPNGEDSANVLRHLDEWVINERPHVVHINAGLHDLKVKGTTYQVPLPEYEKNLATILERVRTGTNATIIFATTTPILDSLHAQRKAGFNRYQADVQRYNAAAAALMKRLGVPVNDLHKVVEDGGKERLMTGDGTHYTTEGYEVLATAVTATIVEALP